MIESPKLTDRQQQILDLVQSTIERTGAPPTRAEIATDPMGVELSDAIVILRPQTEWTTAATREELVERMSARLTEALPGLGFSFSQPIELRMAELISGQVPQMAFGCLGFAGAPPALAAGFLHELGEAIGPRTTLGRRGTPGPAAIAELPPRLYDQLIAQCSERLALKSAHPAAAAAAGPQPRRSSAGAARRAATVRRLGAALRELACLCATGALHPESLRRRPGELTRALDTQDDELWQDALHEELEWQERIRALLESLPGFRRSRGGPQAVQEMLLRLGCYDGLHLDTATRAAWEQRFHKPNAAARARGAALARSRSGAAAAAAATPAVASGPRTRDEQQAHALLLVRRIDRRVSPFSIYRGLAQALLLRVPKAAYSPRQ